MADMLQHFDEQREKRELKREEEREAREEKRRKEQQEADREWALKLEEREEQRKRADAEWRLAAGLKEREALAAQQQSLTEANAAMHVQQTQQQQYTALIARLPKLEGKEMPMAFIQALEKQIISRTTGGCRHLKHVCRGRRCNPIGLWLRRSIEGNTQVPKTWF